MSLFPRLGLTKSEEFYLISAGAAFCFQGEEVSRRTFQDDSMRMSWATRGVGYNVQSILMELFARVDFLSASHPEGELDEAYLDLIKSRVAFERERWNRALGVGGE